MFVTLHLRWQSRRRRCKSQFSTLKSQFSELYTVFADSIAELAEVMASTVEQTKAELKGHYDGYHFSKKLTDIYNPFSLLKCFAKNDISDYWFASGTPSFLMRLLSKCSEDVMQYTGRYYDEDTFINYKADSARPLPMIYQSGYLTIKGYDREADEYTLGLPNKEVRQGLAKGLLASYSNLNAEDVRRGFALRFWQALKTDDINLALTELRSYLAGLPYVEGFKDKLHDVATAEGFYEWTFYLILSMLNIYVLTQVKCIRGRIDMLVYMPHTIYVMEIKLNRTAAEALRQIDDRGYALPYATEGRRVVKVGINFDTATRTLTDWQIIKTTDFSAENKDYGFF